MLSSKICCLPIEDLEHLITKDKQFEFVSSDVKEYDSLPQDFVYIQRVEAEHNEQYKQVIPYCIILCKNKVLRYLRCGDEIRLHDKYSIGIGGHVHENERPYSALLREIKEELGIEAISPKLIGYVNEDITAVGRVHFGAVYVLKLNDDDDILKVLFNEELKNPEWIDIDNLPDFEYELWSELIIDKIKDVVNYYNTNFKNI